MVRRSVPVQRPAIRLRGRHDGALPTHPSTGASTSASLLPRGVVVLLGLACTVVAVAGMRSVSDILGPVLLALMLTVTASPIGSWLRRHGAPAWTAGLALIVTVYLILLGLGGALGFALARLIDLMPQNQAHIAQLRADATRTLDGVGIGPQQVQELTAPVRADGVADLVHAVLGGALGVLSNGFFLLAVLLFLCLDAVHFPARLRRAARERPEVVGALRGFAQGTRRYLLVSTIFGIIVAVIDTLMLWALGIPLPLLWGLLSFITNYIPNIGFVVGLVPPALLGLLEGGPRLMLAVIALYCLVNFVIQSVIQPKIVGDAVGLSASVSFLSLVFWTWVLGPLGALLAIPLSLLTKGLLVDIDPATRWIGALISSTGAQEEPATGDRPAPVPPG
ncbi:AI-2E family transporter [Actinoplanes sp. NPDC048791]|uniref:AI-2E family transporter n=1 Tax=Actinoplanes sp. NPDC048791 TaxID=3154623 RepID=UPI0033EE7397